MSDYPNSITIEIPLPPAAVKPHNSGAWYGKSAGVREYREVARLLAWRTRGCSLWHPAGFKVRIHHEWFLGPSPREKFLGAKSPMKWKKYRPADEGNAIQALKPAIDGIVDSGILADDRAAYVEWGTFTRHSTKEAHGGRSCVVLTLELLGDKPVPVKATRPTKRK